MDEELRNALARMAEEMPPHRGIPPGLVGRGRRRAVLAVTAAVAVVAVAGTATYAGVRAIGRSRPHVPSGQPSGAGRIVFTRLYRVASPPASSAVDQGYELSWAPFSIQPDGTDLQALPVPVDAAYSTALAWSPDGSQLAFSRIPDEGPAWNREIYVVGADGSDLTRLTVNDADDTEPAWSPDGTRIAFVSDRADPDAHQVGHAPVLDLYVMNVDGRGTDRLTQSEDCGGNGAEWPAWSPTGDRLAFAMPHVQATGQSVECWFDLYLIEPDGASLTPLTETPGREGHPAWSPDSGRIAFDRQGGSSDADLYVVDRDGGHEIRLTDDPAADRQPGWSPDGFWIVFTSTRGDLTLRMGEGDPGNGELYLVPSTGGAAVRLTDDPDWDGSAVWLP